MNRCVGVHSRLAYGYVRFAPRRRRIVAQRQTKLSSTTRTENGGGTEPPQIEVLRERLAQHVATLTPTDILLSRAAALVE
jgi:hypothetical protein